MSTTDAPVDHAWVQAAPFRAHLQCLVANSGLPWRVVALAAGLPAGTAKRLMGPSRGAGEQLRREDAQALLATTVDSLALLQRRRVAVTEARRALRWLRERGAPLAWVHSRTGIESYLLELLDAGRADTIGRLQELQLCALQQEVAQQRSRAGARLPAMNSSRSNAA